MANIDPTKHVMALVDFAEAILHEARDRGLLASRRPYKRHGAKPGPKPGKKYKNKPGPKPKKHAATNGQAANPLASVEE